MFLLILLKSHFIYLSIYSLFLQRSIYSCKCSLVSATSLNIAVNNFNVFKMSTSFYCYIHIQRIFFIVFSFCFYSLHRLILNNLSFQILLLFRLFLVTFQGLSFVPFCFKSSKFRQSPCFFFISNSLCLHHFITIFLVNAIYSFVVVFFPFQMTFHCNCTKRRTVSFCFGFLVFFMILF